MKKILIRINRWAEISYVDNGNPFAFVTVMVFHLFKMADRILRWEEEKAKWFEKETK